MSRSLTAVCLTAVLVLAGCTPTMTVSAERDPNADLLAYRSYAWLAAPPKDPQFSNANADLLDWRVRTAVDTEMHARGYTRTAPDAPDLWVRYHIHIRETDVESFQDYYWYRMGGGSDSPQDTFVFGYEEATLIVELLDAQTRQLVWRASVAAPRSKESKQERVAQAVALMFEKYPIQAVSRPPR